MGILWDIFGLFTRVALFSWVGGLASLALLQRESTSVGWVMQEEFADAVAVGNSLPGPIAQQVSAYIGSKLAVVGVAFALLTYTTINPVFLVFYASAVGMILFFIQRGI